MKPRTSQRLLLILLRQNHIIPKGYTSGDALENRAAQGIQVIKPVRVEVLILPDIRVHRIQSAESRDINKQPCEEVDPTRINDIQGLSALTLTGPWIDIQQVPARSRVFGGRVLDDGVVEVVSEIEQCGTRDLGIDVPIPGEDLLFIKLTYISLCFCRYII